MSAAITPQLVATAISAASIAAMGGYTLGLFVGFERGRAAGRGLQPLGTYRDHRLTRLAEEARLPEAGA